MPEQFRSHVDCLGVAVLCCYAAGAQALQMFTDLDAVGQLTVLRVLIYHRHVIVHVLLGVLVSPAVPVKDLSMSWPLWYGVCTAAAVLLPW